MKRLLRHAAQVLPGLLAIGLAAFVLRSADLGRVLESVRSLGFRLPLLLLPNLAVTLLEAVAWWRSFGLLGARPAFASLVGVRLATEAVMLGLPSGAVISESLQPWLLKRRAAVPLETAVVASVGRKFFVVVSHGLVLALATFATWPLLSRLSPDAIGRPGLPWLLLAVAAFMIATFGFGLALSGRARLAQRTRAGLDRVGGRWLGSWLEANARRFQRADDHLLHFFEKERWALVLPLLLYSAGWVVRGVETWVFLRLLGADVGFPAALVVETAIIVVRSVAVPVPAGLGVQDVGYVLCLRALGVPDATTVGTAFVLLKRARDLFWILAGFVLLARKGGAEGGDQPPSSRKAGPNVRRPAFPLARSVSPSVPQGPEEGPGHARTRGSGPGDPEGPSERERAPGGGARDRAGRAPSPPLSPSWTRMTSRPPPKGARSRRKAMTPTPTPRSSRRQFIATAATAAAATTIVPRHVLGGPGFVAPSDTVNVAVVGVGGQGRTNVRSLLHEDDCRIVAIADPCEAWDLTPFYYGGKAGRGPVRAEIEERYRAKTPDYSCAVYEDFRVMLEKEKGIDAVLVATPDHLHAYVTILVMKAGKHVYCEKPLTHDISEARTVARVAKETGVATQMGNQGRSSEGHRQTAEWIWDGAIGPVREVHSWGGFTPFATGRGRPEGTPEVPAGLNWDLWLGPREARPYHPAYAPFGWRGYWAFGGGALPDLAIHHLDPAFNALRLDTPETVEAAATGGVDAEVVGFGTLVTWRFAARGDMVPVAVHWYDGGLRPPTPPGIDPDDPRQRLGEGGSGVVFVGDKGIITCAGWSGMPRLLPVELHREYKRPPKTIPRVPGHHADWLQACKGGSPASGNFDYGARLVEFITLGNVALRARKLIKWDGPAMRVTNAPEANAFLQTPYRAGWELPV